MIFLSCTEETIHRANTYLEAGADSIYVFAMNDNDVIPVLTREIKGPLNILAGPNIPSIPELKELGVARISLGSGPMRATLGLLEAISKELLTSGTYCHLTEKAVSYSALQKLFEGSIQKSYKL